MAGAFFRHILTVVLPVLRTITHMGTFSPGNNIIGRIEFPVDKTPHNMANAYHGLDGLSPQVH
jgi:hypothetical protein